MCYHTSTPSRKTLENKFPNKKVIFEGNEIFHVTGFTRPFLPIETNINLNIIDKGQWKLIPFWVKDETGASNYANTLNAEGESIFDKASYKPYIQKYRGLLYVNGFYEPHKKENLKETENYFIYKPNNEIFTLGIVVSPWLNYDTGEIINTFSIITTPANIFMDKIHNVKKRMPLIIEENLRSEWLNTTNKEEIKKLITPYRGNLAAHKVIRVTAIRNIDTNFKEIQNPI